MTIIAGLVVFCIGAFLGRKAVFFTQELPKILLDDQATTEPRDLFIGFFSPNRCINCSKVLAFVYDLPIIGFLLTKGKCPYCQNSFNSYASEVRRFWFELGIGLLFGLTVLVFSFNSSVLLVLIASYLLICCFMTDYEYGILPDQFTLSLLWIGLIGSLFPIFVTPQEAIIGAVCGYGLFWLINVFYRSLRQTDGMFPGDFKLNAGLGACMGIQWLLPVLIVSLLLIIVIAIGRFLWDKRMPDANDLHKEIAYSCYVSIVAIIALYLRLFYQ